MATMSMGYHYDEGVKVGYDITAKFSDKPFGTVLLSNVSYRDKGRIIREIQSKGVGMDDITVERVENRW